MQQVGDSMLVLAGTNSYAGGTAIDIGTVQVRNNSSLGTGTVAMDGGSLQAGGSTNLTISNAFQLNGGGGEIDSQGLVLTLSGTIVDGLPYNSGALRVFNTSSGGATLLSGVNSYSGGTIIYSGTVQVTNANAVGTGAVTLHGGTFKIDGSVASIAIGNNFKVDTSGGTVDNNAAALTLSGVISNGDGTTGVLQLTNSGGTTGVTTLSGVNTYSGGTKVVNTTVQVTNSQSVGTGTLTLDNAQFQVGGNSNLSFANNFKINNSTSGSTIDARGTTLTIAGDIGNGSGAGKLTVRDSLQGGVVILTGTNTYSGGTDICNCGSLQLGDATHKASIVGDVINNGTFNIVNANMSGLALLATAGGTTTFFGTNTAGAMTINNLQNGLTVFRNASSAANARITNHSGYAMFGLLSGGSTETATAGNAIIDDDAGGTFFLAHTNAGSADITNRNSGASTFVDQSSALSATITNQTNGLTVFGRPHWFDTATAANAAITNNNGGETDFNAFSTAANAFITTNAGGQTRFFDNSTGDKAQFVVNGTGFVDFSASSGPNGDGRISAGSISGNGLIYIGGGNSGLGIPANTLVVGTNNLSSVFGGVIADNNPCGCTSGPANFEKVGTGTLILSGINTYTGITAVKGGALQVDGSVASVQTTVSAGGLLSGVGSVRSTTVADAGAFAPGGGSPGTSMRVAGNLAFQSGALYLVQLNSTTSSFAIVTGAASLNGTVGALFAPGSTVLKQYTIMTTGSHTGSFNAVSAPGGLVGTIGFDPTHVFLNFALNFGANGTGNGNQQNVGNALNNAFSTGGSIPYSFASLTSGQLSQVAGELATGTQQATFDAMILFLGQLTDPSIDGRGGFGATGGAVPFAEEGRISGYAARRSETARDAFAKFATRADVARSDTFDSRWSVWGSAYGGSSNTTGNAIVGSQSTAARAFGLAAGADYRLLPDTLVGFALAGGGTNFSVSGFGTGHSDLFQAGVHARHVNGPAYVSLALAYGWQDITTDRTVTVAGLDRLHAAFKANAWSGRLEGGYRVLAPWLHGVALTPYAAGQFTTFDLPAYAEQVLTGTGAFALAYGAKSVSDPRSELGVRGDRSVARSDGVLTLRSRLAWAHDFNPDRSIAATFQALPGASFVVNGAAHAADTALATVSVEMKWLNGWSAGATFESEASRLTRSYAGKGQVRYAW